MHVLFMGHGSPNEPNADSPIPANNDQLMQERLRCVDTLDFQFYGNEEWDSFAVSLNPDIKVYYPEGSVTTGLFPQHVGMLTPLLAFAADTKITRHPMKFGSDSTAVIGEIGRNVF